LKYSEITSDWGSRTCMPSRDSKAAAAFVGEGAGSDTSVVVTELPLEHLTTPVTLASRVMPPVSLTVPRTRTRSPVVVVPLTLATKRASEVEAFASRSASCSCTKKPFRPSAPSKSPAITPSMVCCDPTTGLDAPAPWIVEMSVAGSPHVPAGLGGGGHVLAAPGLLAAARKSAPFWSVSEPSGQRESPIVPAFGSSVAAPVPSV
jgi:hypothetical protein